MKRNNMLFTRLIALLMMISLLVCSSGYVSAAEEVVDNFSFSVSDNKATITSFPETERGSVVIPSKLNGYPVTTIGESAFFGCTLITDVVIPNTVTSIETYAFAYCTSLSKITIPSSVKTIGKSAFNFCSDLCEVDFIGTESEWNKISIGSNNNSLINATLNFKSAKFGEFSQVHTVNNYLSQNDYYSKKYFSGKAIPLDGSNGNVDMCIPGLSKKDDMVPQGIAYYPERNRLLISSYSSDGAVTPKRPSVIFALDFNTGEYVGEYKLYNSDGTAHTGHVGGIAVSDNNLYITDDNSSISYIPLSELDVDDYTAKSLKIAGTFSISSLLNGAGTSYLSYSDGYLWTGNFYHTSEKYNTPASTTHNSVVLGFKLNGNNSAEEFSDLVKKTNSDYKLKIPNSISKIQGAAVSLKAKKMILMSSYGRKNESTVYTVNIFDNNVTVDDTRSIVGIPMLEGALMIGNEVYSVTESASWYYHGYDIFNKSSDPTDVVWKFAAFDVYNMFEETYQYDNYSDFDSNGHCFGMSITSSGYHIGELNITDVGGSAYEDVYTLESSAKVNFPICFYQDKQSGYSKRAIVAGGTNYKDSSSWNISRDWIEVLNYVRNHEFDNDGSLQIGIRKIKSNGTVGGHAVNFLRYEEVGGQPRIYVYDNNFPERETYFFENSDGEIVQAPESTYSGGVDCIALRSVTKYFNEVGSADSILEFIYAIQRTIDVLDSEGYVLDESTDMGSRIAYEIPSGAEQITIIPLVDYAEFTYLGENYSFGKIDDDTVGILKISSEDGSDLVTPELEIINEPVQAEIRKPSKTEIKYGDSIILHYDGEIPAGYYVEWTADNNNFSFTSNGDTCKITPEKSGNTTFTATIYDANGNAVSEAEQTMKSKAGFFQKLLAFFKEIFGLTKTIPEIFNKK